jgi:hypothetical protein
MGRKRVASHPFVEQRLRTRVRGHPRAIFRQEATISMKAPADDFLGFDDDVGLPPAWVATAVALVLAAVVALTWAVS